MKATYQRSIARLTAAVLAVIIVAGAAPAIASAGWSTGTSLRSSFAPKIAAAEKWAKKVAPAEKTADTLEKAAYKQDAPVPKPQTAGYTPTSSTSGSTSNSAASKASSSSKRSSGSELSQAQSILAGLIAKYPILAGTTVSFGDARGYQAVCYYKSGRIVISPDHTRSLSVILNHEVWHVIDWRDNGQIDWGENVPPQ